MKIQRKATAVIAAATTVLAISACAATDPASGGSGNGLTPEAQEAVDTAFEGTFKEPPTDGPEVEPDKNIWAIAASVQLADFNEPGHFVETAERMGWDLTLFDGQFNPDTIVSGLRQAVADQADGVILIVVDCQAVKAGLEDVAEAGIPIVGWESVDCDQAADDSGAIIDTGVPPLFDAAVTYDNPADPEKPLSYLEYVAEVWARAQALGIAEATDGAAKLIKLEEKDLLSTVVLDWGFEKALAEYCPDCEVVETVEVVGTDLGPTLQDKVAQAIASHPEANAVYSMYDAAALSVAPAVMASGRSDDLFVMGGEGTTTVIELIAEDRGIDAAAGLGFRWEGWASLDAMNRVLAGEKPDGAGFPSGIGAQLIDADRNLPEKGGRFDSSVDFESAYLDAWGVE